jgi:hypothetical protein
MNRIGVISPAGKYPCEGPRAVPLLLTFSAAGSQTVSLYDSTVNRGVTFFVSLFIDNSRNDKRVIVTVDYTSQRIVIPDYGQGIVRILCQNPVNLQFTLEDAPTGTATILVHAVNFYTDSSVWRTEPVALPFPLSLFANGEEGWIFDAMDLSTFYQDAAMTTPANVGDPVGCWRDVSGNNNNRTASGTARPILRLNADTGAYYLEFDGTNDSMVSPSVNLSATNKISAVVGARRSGTLGRMVWEFSANATANLGTCYFTYGDNTTPGSGPLLRCPPGSPASSPFFRKTAIVSTITDNVITTLFDTSLSNGSKCDWRMNGVSVGAWNSVQGGTGNFGNFPFYFGSRGGTSQFFNSRDFGGILVGRALTADELAQSENYVARRIGIVL